MTLVDNSRLRNAVAAFAAKREQSTYLEVLRNLLQGSVLFDITGSDFAVSDDGSTVSPGSSFTIRGGNGPDGERALFAFTRQEEIAKMHAADVQTKSLGQPAASVLEFAAKQGDSWLYIDPAGPTCAIRISEADFILRNPRNDAVKDALAGTPAEVLDALAKGGSLFYAITENPDGSIEVHTTNGPGGVPARLAFTSPAEIVVSAPGAAWVAVDVARVIDEALAPPFEGLVINPAMPWIGIHHSELAELKARLQL